MHIQVSGQPNEAFVLLYLASGENIVCGLLYFFLANMAMASQPKKASLWCIKQLQICHLADYPKQHIECSICFFLYFFLKVQAASTGIVLKDKANNSEKPDKDSKQNQEAFLYDSRVQFLLCVGLKCIEPTTIRTCGY